MNQKISKLIIVFGVSFILINVIGYIFKIPSLLTILNNPNGTGGTSISNIPTILSILITAVIYIVKHFLTNKKIIF